MKMYFVMVRDDTVKHTLLKVVCLLDELRRTAEMTYFEQQRVFIFQMLARYFKSLSRLA